MTSVDKSLVKLSLALQKWVAIAGSLLIFVCAGCSPSQDSKNQFEYAGATMGTTFSVAVPTLPDQVDTQVLQQRIDQSLLLVNRQMSTYQNDSELSLFNQSRSTDWFPVSADVVTVVTEALAIAEKTQGAYDVTVGPLVNLWGFGPDLKPDQVPATADIEEALANKGSHWVHVQENPPALKKDKATLYIDLSSLAKGFGVDKVAEILEDDGIENYLVEVGGEIRVKGNNSQDVPWRIAIEKPLVGQRSVQEIVSLNEGAIATSGDYRNYFEENGKRYSHTIDARNGYPITHKLVSVSVYAENAMEADAIATALMVLGPEEGFKLAQQQNWAAYFIFKLNAEAFTVKSTSSFPLNTEEKEHG